MTPRDRQFISDLLWLLLGAAVLALTLLRPWRASGAEPPPMVPVPSTLLKPASVTEQTMHRIWCAPLQRVLPGTCGSSWSAPAIRTSPAIPAPISQPSVTIDYTRLAAIVLDRMAEDSRFRGPPGERGPAGPPGAPGEARPVAVDYDRLAATLSDVWAARFEERLRSERQEFAHQVAILVLSEIQQDPQYRGPAGPPGEITQQQIDEIARRLGRKIAGAIRYRVEWTQRARAPAHSIKR